MTKTELLDAAFTKLADAATLLDSAGDELLADGAVELALFDQNASYPAAAK